jgi:hypothetical protein
LYPKIYLSVSIKFKRIPAQFSNSTSIRSAAAAAIEEEVEEERIQHCIA